jgi:phage gp16-like protein
MSIKLIGKKEKALIHVAKAKLSMSDEQYRELLATVGVSSSTQLSYAQFDELMDKLKGEGFKPASGSPKQLGIRFDGPKEKQPMLLKIGTILNDLNMAGSYADKVAKKMFGIDRLRWCTREQTWKVLQALIIFQNRRTVLKEENTG